MNNSEVGSAKSKIILSAEWDIIKAVLKHVKVIQHRRRIVKRGRLDNINYRDPEWGRN